MYHLSNIQLSQNFRFKCQNVWFLLQASELEVLQAVLKWGEHELIRRMEDQGQCMVVSVHFDFACCVDCSYTNFIRVAQSQTCWATQLILWHGKVLRSEIWVMWSCVRFCQSCCHLWGWIMSCHLAVMYWIKQFDEDWWVIDGRMSVEISNCNSSVPDMPYSVISHIYGSHTSKN